MERPSNNPTLGRRWQRTSLLCEGWQLQLVVEKHEVIRQIRNKNRAVGNGTRIDDRRQAPTVPSRQIKLTPGRRRNNPKNADMIAPLPAYCGHGANGKMMS